MSFKLSTGLRNAILGDKAVYSATSLACDNATNAILDSGGLLLSEGFRPGDTVLVEGYSTNAAAFLATIDSVESDGSGAVLSNCTLSDESEGAVITITACSKGWKDIFANHVIHVYSGSPPATADLIETGTLLLKITKESGAFTPGDSTNGLNFDAIADGVISKDSEIHSGVGLDDATAGYYRIYDNAEETGASSTAIRAQGSVGITSADFLMSSTSITTGSTTTLGTHNVTLPTL
jgi:hypothetical protein